MSISSTVNKNQLWLWFSILLAAILIITVVIYLLVSNILNIDSKGNITKSQDTIKYERETKLTQYDIIKTYAGTRESIDGSIETVLFDINSIDTVSDSFEFTLNIGLSKKIKGYGNINLKQRKINADVIGELVIIIDNNGRVKLKSVNEMSNKYNLIEEAK